MADTEAVLLRRFAKNGDAEAFAEIIRRHAGLVYGAALRVLADMDRAADVAQDTFLQLTKDAGFVTGSLPGWLHRVATHKAIDQVRREASRRNRETQYATDQVRHVAQWKDISPYVDEGLNELDTELRDILVAHFLEGRTTRHIAAARKISQATVSRRIEAGVTNLRRVLRRRGVIVAAGGLTLLLGRNGVQAAPVSLMTELGKMAMAGGHAAAVSSAAAGGASGFEAVASGVLASLKSHAVVAASVAVVAVAGAGSVAVYRHTGQASTPPTSQMVVAAPQETQDANSSEALAAQPADGVEEELSVASDAEREPSGVAGIPLTGELVPTGGPTGYHAAGVTPPSQRDPNDCNYPRDRDESDDGRIGP